MSYLSIFKQDKVEKTIQRVSLDDAWFRAELLGRVELGKKLFGDNNYTAEITFYTKNGSYVSAKGEDQNPIFALEKCIEEAKQLGAKEK